MPGIATVKMDKNNGVVAQLADANKSNENLSGA
jgi:hypothetical protein